MPAAGDSASQHPGPRAHASTDPAAEDSADREAGEAAPIRVLLVEDNGFDAARVEDLLRDEGREAFVLDRRPRLAEALEALDAHEHDVVLLDLTLPDSSGLDTLKRLHAAHPEVPVVVMTMLDDARLPAAALGSGAQDYVVKWERDAFSLGRALRYAIERHRAHRALAAARDRERHLATHDPLTDLPNRALFLDRLTHALEGARRRGRRVALLFLDVDRFKDLNDTLGHAVGDEVLRTLAGTLRACIRRSDTPGRMGGDEFAVVLEDIRAGSDAGRVARAIEHRVSRPRLILGQEVSVTLSLGIAVFPDDGETPDDLLRNADTAMYCMKEGGRNGYAFFSSEMDARYRRHLALERALREAVRTGRLTCHFQPQVDVERRLVGVEALARWRAPRLGWIAPDEFVPLAERRGIAVALGDHVLRVACAASREWSAQGRPLRLAVNVAARQLAHPQFAASVRRILASEEFALERLDLEIPACSLAQEGAREIEALRELRSEGVRVSIDDFGTGPSCLGTLKHLPVDAIKIDPSFVHGCVGDPADAAIVRTLAGLAAELGLDAVAKGVETPEQCEVLTALGCRTLQGHLFGRPAPRRAFARRFLSAEAAAQRSPRVGREREGVSRSRKPGRRR